MAERKKEVVIRWIVGYVSTSQWSNRRVIKEYGKEQQPYQNDLQKRKIE